MENKIEKISKRKTPPLTVYCLPDERAKIVKKADEVGLSVSEYMLNVAVGYPVVSRIDRQATLDLIKVSGDLGRLGGLLKHWLNNDEKTRHFNVNHIKALVTDIQKTKNILDTKIDDFCKKFK